MSDSTAQSRLTTWLGVGVGVVGLVVGASGWLGTFNSTQTRVNSDIPQQIKDLTDKIKESQNMTNTQFLAISTAIHELPNLQASNGVMEREIASIERQIGEISNKIDRVSAQSVQTSAELNAALKMSLSRQGVHAQ